MKNELPKFTMFDYFIITLVLILAVISFIGSFWILIDILF